MRKKPGPKPRTDAMVKRNSITFRVRAELREMLTKAAEANDRSLSDELAYRIQQSFDQPALIDALADRLEAKRRDAEARTLALKPGFPFRSYSEIYQDRD